jgi:hypothetical protein
VQGPELTLQQYKQRKKRKRNSTKHHQEKKEQLSVSRDKHMQRDSSDRLEGSVRKVEVGLWLSPPESPGLLSEKSCAPSPDSPSSCFLHRSSSFKWSSGWAGLDSCLCPWWSPSLPLQDGWGFPSCSVGETRAVEGSWVPSPWVAF